MEPYPLLLYLILLLLTITFIVDLTLRNEVESTLPPRILTFLYLSIIVPIWAYYDVYWEGVDDIMGWLTLPSFLFAFLWSLGEGHLVFGWFGLFIEDDEDDEEEEDEIWEDDDDDNTYWVEESWIWEDLAGAWTTLTRREIWFVILWVVVLSTLLLTTLFYYINWWLLGVVDPDLKDVVSGGFKKLFTLLM